MAINYHTVTHNISRVPLLPPLPLLLPLPPLLPLPLLPPLPLLEIAPCIYCHLSSWLAVADAILLRPVAALPSTVTASTVAAC
jgi:hypothetical protein